MTLIHGFLFYWKYINRKIDYFINELVLWIDFINNFHFHYIEFNNYWVFLIKIELNMMFSIYGYYLRPIFNGQSQGRI